MGLALVPLAAWYLPKLWRDDPATQAAPPAVGFGEPVGERLTSARCFMVVVDESSSMADADVSGSRADAVRAATDFLAAYGRSDDRIGTTWFADTAAVDGPRPASTDATSKPASPTEALGSGTDIAGALRAAVEAMDARCANAKPVIVLVSDGQPSSADQFAATADVIASAGSGLDLHLIAMNGNDAFEGSRSFWEDLTLGVDSIETIVSFGRDEVAAAMAKILTLETGQQVAADTSETTAP